MKIVIALGGNALLRLAYGQHDMLQHGQQPIPAANGTRQRTGSADGKTG